MPQRTGNPLVLFLLRQSIQFAFRAILISLNGYDKRTDELRILKRYVRSCIPALDAIFRDDTEDGRGRSRS